MRLLLSLVAVAISAAAPAQTTVIDSIQSSGLWRAYRLYLPANYNANTAQRPLLLNLHGLGSSALEQEAYGDFRPIADTAGFLVVHPDGTQFSGVRYWNAGVIAGGANDVIFLSALIDTLSARYRVNAQRVYSTGMSNGGYMSYYLASYLPQKIAAIASVTGAITPANFPPPAPTHQMPVMQIHGTADATVPYNGGTNNIPIDTLVKHWVAFNGCNPTPQVTAIPNTSTTDGSTAERFLYTGGAAGSTVEFFKVTGGGHTWPGSAFTIGVTNQDFSASREIWRFLRQYNIAGLATSVRSAALHPALHLRAVPNPAHTLLRIDGAEPNGLFEVVDIAGRSMRTGSGNSLSLDGLATGAYTLRYLAPGGQRGTVTFVKE